MKTMGAFILATVTVLALAFATIAAYADDDDHERALEAVQSGELLPLSRILISLRETMPGDVLEVDLEREHGRWIYEIEVLLSDGRVVDLKIDGQSGEVLREDDDHEDYDDDD